ncbi:MAG: ATP-binding protein [Armatimonadota bacterium]|nr:ATP-binding protein [Armatimonadota bacterium]
MRQGEVIHLEIPSSPEYVAVVRRAVEGIAQRMHFNAAQIEDLKVAVGEACANAILHGCPRSEQNNVEVRCEVRADGLLVEVRNSVEGTCRPQIPAKPELNREGGLGLYIIKQLMDEVQFTWTKKRAVLRMVKRL